MLRFVGEIKCVLVLIVFGNLTKQNLFFALNAKNGSKVC